MKTIITIIKALITKVFQKINLILFLNIYPYNYHGQSLYKVYQEYL